MRRDLKCSKTYLRICRQITKYFNLQLLLYDKIKLTWSLKNLNLFFLIEYQFGGCGVSGGAGIPGFLILVLQFHIITKQSCQIKFPQVSQNTERHLNSVHKHTLNEEDFFSFFTGVESSFELSSHVIPAVSVLFQQCVHHILICSKKLSYVLF